MKSAAWQKNTEKEALDRTVRSTAASQRIQASRGFRGHNTQKMVTNTLQKKEEWLRK